MQELSVGTQVAIAGFLAGILFGATAQRTNFCTMGAISDMVLVGDRRRLRAWLLAIAVAILGAQALHLSGQIDLNRSIYLTPNLGWLGAIVGGLLFGFGMTLAGGCGNKTLVRLGGGNLKSLVVALVMGLFGYMTMRGLISAIRLKMEAQVNLDLAASGIPHQGLVNLLAPVSGIGEEPLRLAMAALLVGAILFYCFKDAAFRASRRDLAAGLIIGSLIPVGWGITGILGQDPFTPIRLASFSFVGPTANSLMYLMTFTGATMTFGIATVGGVVVGAFLMAVATRSFRLEGFDAADDFFRHLLGAAFMGVGGVFAMGCTIGQGLTGLSTLALSSVIAFLSIIAGGIAGIRYLEQRI